MTAEEKIIAAAQEAIQIEIEGLNAIKTQIGTDFVRLVNACMETLEKNGKIVITGVGKSGHIGKKMAATLASTGSTSIFMHPVEAMHGDLGMLQENDIMLALSYSGETQELTRMIVPAKRLGVPVACFTGVADSTLAKLSDIAVIASVEREACPFNLAPTTTSTAHLALGDALATVELYENLVQSYYNQEAFMPKPLEFKVKKESPITKAQKERLTLLLAKHNLEPKCEITSMTRNEASRYIDQILAAYGR